MFLDRDGVINRKAPEGGYITRWEDFHVLPGVFESIAILNQAGFCVIVATNQRCVAKSLVSAAEVAKLHEKMTDFLAQHGARVDAVYCCPHELTPVCRCRKPAPGMLLDAARDHNIDLNVSWMVGDSDIDVLTGKNARCKTALLTAADVQASESSADIIAHSLLDAIQKMVGRISKPSVMTRG